MKFIAFLILIGIPMSIFFLVYLYHYRQYKLAFSDELLVLIAYVCKVDGVFSKIEEAYITQLLFKKYGKRRQKKFLKKIHFHHQNKTNPGSAISKINSKGSVSTKIQLLHILVKISTIDSYLTDSEHAALSKITHKLRLTHFQLDSLLAMCNFTSERAERQKKHYKKKTKISKQSNEKIALRILELDENATNEAIKKSYRKLVNIHHPDKVLHLTKVMQNIAKEEFLKISEAYELLKTNRGFK